MLPKRHRSAKSATNARSELRQSLDHCRSAFVGAGFFSLIINLLMLTGPLFMLQVYDRVLASRSVPTLIALTCLVAGLYVFLGVLEFVRSRVLSRVGSQISRDLNPRTFNIWVTGGLAGRQVPGAPLQDLQSLRSFLAGSGPAALFDMPWVPVYLAIIFLFHWTLGLVATVGALIILSLAIINEFLTRSTLEDAHQFQLQSTTFAQHCHRNAEAVVAMGMTQQVQSRWLALQNKAASGQLLVSDRAGGIASASKSFRRFLQSAILAVGAVLAIQQLITPGVMIAASIIMGRALAPIDQAIGQWKGFINTRQAWNRLSTLFNSLPDVAKRTALPAPKGRLTVDNVIARPPNGEKPILEAVSFNLEPGQGLGVIGPSASGKTTLARLLTGLWMPIRGSIRLDGATLDQWDTDDLGRHIGYLPQDIELFDGSVRDNIARFADDASDEAVVEAANWAGAHDMILAFPEGYDTTIGDRGAVLSGGQRQRIGLARALFGNPALVVLDEPNASLDSAGDDALTGAIKGLRERQKTVVVMAHRPSAIAAVDMLLMLKNGQQCAFGPKENVLREVTQLAPTSPEAAKGQRLAS